MKHIILLTCAVALASCASQKQAGKIQSITALTEVFGDGQKTTAALVEYDREIENEKLDKASFSVEGRTITAVYANAEPEKSEEGKDGKYVIIELAKDDATAATFIPKGKDSEIRTAKVAVSQLKEIATSDAKSIAPTEKAIDNDKVVNLIVDDFTQHEYQDQQTGITVKYNLYVPKNYDKNKSYPMVMFIHDAGVVSPEIKATLMQGLGAVIWASPEEQAKHEAFVLAPQYSVVTVNDQSEFTEDLDATVNLINELTSQYNIDKNRLYTTGQSMGCMSSIALDIKYPDLFAASFLVAGQWDASKVAPMANDKLWIIVSEGDNKAFPGMNAITAALEKEGAKVSRATFNGKATPEEFAEDVKKVLAQGNKIQYTPLKAGTVVPPDMQGQGGSDHRATWRIAYTIEGVRDWLFEQSK
ncbi:alpha/beta hydrolase-fold protein [Olivibacter sitiensis]|uniref:alpha/beta hydrolase-fold protein n=1 Tax=Olivibacter sitiensis TaxID=376470 RepID=UPI0004136433|nr:alpha/beta hydrolase-fold protein [Olivibacter sitiensis]